MIIVNEQITIWKVTIVTHILAFVPGDEGKSGISPNEVGRAVWFLLITKYILGGQIKEDKKKVHLSRMV
jgi:hypothetical protein